MNYKKGSAKMNLYQYRAIKLEIVKQLNYAYFTHLSDIKVREMSLCKCKEGIIDKLDETVKYILKCREVYQKDVPLFERTICMIHYLSTEVYHGTGSRRYLTLIDFKKSQIFSFLEGYEFALMVSENVTQPQFTD